MDVVLRAAAIYLILLIIFKIAGRRTLGEITTFDFVLLLVIGEATQQALLGNDFSLINSFLAIVSLIAIDITLSLIKERSPSVAKLIDGVAMIVVEDGKLLHERVRKARLDEDDILTAARETQGLERLDQIKFAVLENNGKISIIPKQQ
jgi:uncharacterized membrane protein YcaP (DUF421 family)